MARAIKERTVAEFTQRYGSVRDCVVCGYQGTSAQEFGVVRGALASKGVEIHVVKSSLFERALEQAGRKNIGRLLGGPCAVATGGQDPLELVKAVMGASKECKTLTVRGALVEGRTLDADETQAVGRIPSRLALYGQIVGLMAAPLRGVAGAFAGLARSLGYAFAGYRDKLAKESESSGQASGTIPGAIVPGNGGDDGRERR
ncbi:MAG: 50S ribosomal protein L10 [Planctomycetota bacterium]